MPDLVSVDHSEWEAMQLFLTRAQQENVALRRELWLMHGRARHPDNPLAALYGDDGEMSCNACMIDFKRWPVEQIRERIHTRASERAQGSA